MAIISDLYGRSFYRWPPVLIVSLSTILRYFPYNCIQVHLHSIFPLQKNLITFILVGEPCSSYLIDRYIAFHSQKN